MRRRETDQIFAASHWYLPSSELLRENKRLIDKAIRLVAARPVEDDSLTLFEPCRDLDRERMGLQNQEKKIIADIKKMAKEGQMEAVKVLAKSMVRNRHAVTKMYGLKSQLQAVSLRIATLKSTQSMAEAMKGATKAMKMMNKQLNLPQLQAIMREFEKQNERMEMTGEVMGDAVDDALGDEDEEEETDALVGQVLDEIGIEVSGMASAPGNKVKQSQQEVQQEGRVAEGPLGAGGGAGPAAATADAGGLDDDLQSRLDALRKG